jgi:RHS repeat-associated protein
VLADAYTYDNGQANKGQVRVYHGSCQFTGVNVPSIYGQNVPPFDGRLPNPALHINNLSQRTTPLHRCDSRSNRIRQWRDERGTSLRLYGPRTDLGAFTRTITYTYPLGRGLCGNLHRLTGATYSTGEAYAYQYDAVGNRTAMTSTTPLSGTVVTTYTYDAANRLTNIKHPSSNIQYVWDARGNLTHDGVFTYTYNAAGRMVRAESFTATLRYTYTVDGLRVAQDVDGAVTTFAWDWATGIPEMLSDGSAVYLVGHDTLGWEDGAGSWTYAVPDALGSVRQAVDATAAVVAAREWTPYGVESGGAQAGLGYTGEWWDAAVGLQYLRARWYDGQSGRFTQKDPLRLEDNLYAYAQANPIHFTDPSGYLSNAEIAESFGFGSFSEVYHWFANLETKSGRLIDDTHNGRWGFLALLMEAKWGDKITGLTLKIGGRKGEIDLGVIGRMGCAYGIRTPDMRVYSLPDYIEEYLLEVNSSDNIGAEVPPWRTVVERYRLNDGKAYRDLLSSDLPDWYAVGFDQSLYAPAGGAGIGGSIQVTGISDRYGNDYISVGLNGGLGIDLWPLPGVEYAEGYTVDQSWPRSATILDESRLVDAMVGFDSEFGFTFLLSARVSVNLFGPINASAVFGAKALEVLAAGLGVSYTWLAPNDNPLTEGWQDLDEIPYTIPLQ